MIYIYILKVFPLSINTFITSHIYLCVCVYENTYILISSKFKLYNILLSTRVTMLYMTSSDLIHLIMGSFTLY